MLPTYVGVIIGVVCALVFGFLGVLMGIQYRKKFAEAEIGSAEQEAKRIIEEGSKVAEQKKKEALIEAKEEILKSKNELDKEIKDRRNEVSRLERRCVSREESLDRKLDQLEKKDESLNQKIKEYEDKTAEVEQIKVQQTEKLEELSGLTAESAKELLIAQVEEQARFEAAQKLIEIETQLKEDAEEKARNIIALAISRIASDQVAESTVSVVALPNDDMKGRIIGREGRNIRAVETATGVDLIIDDTPEAITISSFDPIRREVARLTLEKLVSDGRIHPTRIEETVEKAKREVESRIKQAGEKAVFETGIHGLNNELVKILGRLMYRTSYGQNVLNHSVEVSYIAGIIADELGVDGTLARRAGLLHDIGKAMTQEVEGSHVQIGVEIAKKYKENKDVIHAIEAHHGDVEPRTVTAMIVQAADAISAARPGARREDIENFIKRLQKLEEICSGFDGVDKAYAIQAGREVRVMVKPEEVNDQSMVLLARDMAKKIEGELKYPGQIKVNIIRESRATDFAK
ncbi:MAG: ribonuclease Y [Clostridiales bacterium]|nr:ribonuclease Y [Clostridiales bacterium]HCH68242.1 ribonuclease Y [Clostridiales bacterium]